MPDTAAAQPLTNDLTIEVEGSALAAEVKRLVVLAYIEDNRALPDTFELRFRDPDRIALDKGRLTIGAKVRLGVRGGDDSATTWLLTGEITALEVELDARGSWTIVRGYDAIHRLQRGRRVAAYRKQTAGDIVRKVAGQAGVPVGSVDGGPTVLAEVIQANVSDWEFLSQLAHDVGLELTTSEGRIGLRKPAQASSGTPIVLTLGENLIRFRAGVTAAEHVKEVQVRVWDPKTKNVLVGKHSAASTGSTSIGMGPQQTVSSFGDRTLTVTDAPYATDQGHVNALAASMAEQVAGAFAELEGVVRGDPKLTSGSVIELKGVGKPFEGKYVVTSSRHVYDGEEGFQTWITVSGGQDRTLLGLVARGAGSAGAIPGLVPAIVTNTKDPDKLGRVKLKLPWLDDTLETDWARTLQLGGKGGGGLIVPEVDDEVLVGFEQGRIERPFVLGGLYNGKDKPGGGESVDGSSGSISRRALASRSGNRVEILDAPNGDNGVRMSTGDDKFLIFLDKKNTKITVTSGGKVEIAGDSDITITAKGNATLEAKGNLTLKATGNIKAEATGNLELSATANASLKGTAKAEVSSTGQTSISGTQAELKGTAMTSITGGLVKIN